MENKTNEKPEILTNDHLFYLDALRESGITNMYGAGSYLQDKFGMTKQEAKQVLMYWMRTFSKRHRTI